MFVQGSFFAREPDGWVPPPADTWPNWSLAKRVGLDCETADKDLKKLGPGVRRDGRVVGVSFCLEGGKPVYLPYGHGMGGNLPKPQVVAYLKEQCKNFRGEIVGANLSYDLDYLFQLGIRFHPSVKFRDVLVADALIQENSSSYTLDAVSKRHGFPGKDERKLRQAALDHGFDPKAELWKLHSGHVGVYAEVDAILPLQVYAKQREFIEEHDLHKIWDIESRLLPVLLAMRRKGVAINQDRLEEIGKLAERRAQEACSEIYAASGYRINPSQVGKVGPVAGLAEVLGITLPLTPNSGKPSVTKEFVEAIDNPVMAHLIEARKWMKLQSTYVGGMQKNMVNGRIHCTLNQSVRERDDGTGLGGAKFGRLSCQQPNLQNQPIRDEEIGAIWRSIFIPDGGGIWYCNDFSQQEPRITVHYAEVVAAQGAYIAGDLYRNNPDTDFHNMMRDLSGLPRTDAKALFLGMVYGMGGAKLCDSLGLPTEMWYPEDAVKPIRVAGEAGKRLIKAFHQAVPWLNGLNMAVRARVREVGEIRTLGGRICHFPQLPNGEFDWIHKALNRLIQGSAGDQTKQALVDIAEAGYEPQLQVHDEVDGSAGSEQEAQAIGEIMVNAMPLRVPSKVDCEIGPDWGVIGNDALRAKGKTSAEWNAWRDCA
jgi:DNA polymerase I-like protein with 3'-5' exonuclease and polymerase domains